MNEERTTKKEKTIRCPKCGKPTSWKGNPSKPFCSERCRLIDLGAWSEGAYSIPGEDSPPDGEGEDS